MKNTQKGSAVLFLIVIIAVLLLLIGAYVYKQRVAIPINRAKVDDAAIGSWIEVIIPEQAKTYYAGSGNNSYTGVCADPHVAESLAKISTISGMVPTCNSSATAFAISSASLLEAYNNKFWCADSTGSSGRTATPLGAGTVCPK